MVNRPPGCMLRSATEPPKSTTVSGAPRMPADAAELVVTRGGRCCPFVHQSSNSALPYQRQTCSPGLQQTVSPQQVLGEQASAQASRQPPPPQSEANELVRVGFGAGACSSLAKLLLSSSGAFGIGFNLLGQAGSGGEVASAIWPRTIGRNGPGALV